MKAAIALIFFACFAGSMATDARSELVAQLLQQGQAVAQTIFAQLQQQILGFVQQAVGQLSSLVGSLGRLDFDFNAIVEQFRPLVSGFIQQALNQVLSGLSGLMGGRAGINLGEIFSEFFQSITTPLAGIGQHLLNQGLASVLGGLGSLGASRAGFNDLWNSLTSQISSAVTVAQGALNGALGNLSALGSSILDASKPHWENLQEQIVGHGLNVLGSISESVNNLHGSLTGGR